MMKYLIWIFKVVIPILWNYLTWMRRYARHPERFSQKERFARCQKLARKVLRLLKVDVEIRNAPVLKDDEVYYFVGNHTSLLDAVITIAALPVASRFVSKKENRTIPIVNTALKVVEALFIDRDNLKQEIKAMQLIRESLGAKASSWTMFPEGTRKKNYHAPLLDYKAGSFKAALQTNTTIIPFVLQGTQLVLPFKSKAPRYLVILNYLDPVMPVGTTAEIAKKIYDESSELSNKLKLEYADRQKLNKFGRKFITPPPQAPITN